MKKKAIMIFMLIECLTTIGSEKSIGQNYPGICEYIKNKFKSKNFKVDDIGKLDGYVQEGKENDGFLKYFLKDDKNYEVDYKENHNFESNGILTINKQEFDIVKDIKNRNIADLSGIYNRPFSFNGISMRFYEANFNKNKYLIAFSHISGYTKNNPFTMNFCIFDMEDSENIKYYFMQSYLGCIDNIGDFNNDGIFDILVSKITGYVKPNDNIHSDPKYYELRMYSLINDEFVIDQNHYSKLKDSDDNKEIIVIEEDWDF